MTSSRLLLIIAALLLLPACAIGRQRFGRVIDTAKIPQVKVGKSNKQHVLDLFGPPSTYSRLSNASVTATVPESTRQIWVDAAESEDVFTYEYREENEGFFTILLYTFFSRDTITDTLMVFFDSRDVVQYLAFAKQTTAEPEKKEEKGSD